MTLHITIHKFPRSTLLKTAVDHSADAAGAADTIANGASGDELDKENAVAQLAAQAAGNFLTPATALTVSAAASNAATYEQVVLQRDIDKLIITNNSFDANTALTVGSDALTVINDIYLQAAAYTTLLPGGAVEAKLVKKVGDIFGAAATGLDLIVDVRKGINDLPIIENKIASTLSNTSNALMSAWIAAEALIAKELNSLSNALDQVPNTLTSPPTPTPTPTPAPTPLPPVTSTGSINSTGEKDPFSVSLTAGFTYQFDLDGQGSGKGTLPNPYLQLVSSTGSIIKGPDNIAGGDARLTYTPTTSGTYTLDVSSASNRTGTYQLIASPQDDYTDTTATTGEVDIGGSAVGALQAMTDQDYFKVILTAGSSYEFDLNGKGSGNGTLPNPYLQLVSSTGTIIKGPDNIAGGDARLTYTPTTSGTYYLDATSASNSTGTYILSAIGPTMTTPTPPPTLVAGGFDGDQVRLDTYSPSIAPENLLGTSTTTVVPGTTTHLLSGDTPANGTTPDTVDLARADITITGDTITFLEAADDEGATFNNGTFNGTVITDLNPNAPRITGITLQSTNIPGLTRDDFSFTDHTIAQNFAGVTLPSDVQASTVISVQFATTPTAAMLLMSQTG